MSTVLGIVSLDKHGRHSGTAVCELTHLISVFSYPKVDGDSLFHHEYSEKRKKGNSRRMNRSFQESFAIPR